MFNINPQTHQQTGVALIAALVIMLILTIVGVTAINMTSLEEKMAFNSQDRQQARYLAESALLLYAQPINTPSPSQPGLSAKTFTMTTGEESPTPNLQSGSVTFTYLGTAFAANVPSPNPVVRVPSIEPVQTYRLSANVTTKAGTNSQLVAGYYFYKQDN